MSNIVDFYVANLWQTAGNTEIDRSAMAAQYKTGLFPLVYWLLYNADGRKFLHDYVPNKAPVNLTEEQVRAALREKFESEYNVSPAASAALISVHFAGLGWVDAHNAGQIELRNQHEAAFKQSMAAVAWLMWEDGSGPLFSLGW